MLTSGIPEKCAAAALVICAWWVVGDASAAELVYRYVTPQGEIVVTDSPLPEHAIYGYDVIDPDSDTVIRHVGPQQSRNAYQAEQARRAALEECQNELRSLRYRYASLTDIELVRESNLAAIEHRATTIRSERVRAESDLADNRGRAAESERAGEGVVRRVSTNIDGLQTKIVTLNEEAVQNVRAQEAAEARFAREIDLFAHGTCEHLSK